MKLLHIVAKMLNWILCEIFVKTKSYVGWKVFGAGVSLQADPKVNHGQNT